MTTLRVALVLAGFAGVSLRLPAADESGILACSYNLDLEKAPLPEMAMPGPTLGELDQYLLQAFIRAYGNKVPQVKILSLKTEPNARVGPFGIALNGAWLASQGEAMGTAILAHELGHLCQAYKLLPISEECKSYGPEGEVEFYAGRLLAASGMTEEMFEGAIAPVISRYPDTPTKPAGHIRVMLMRAGFYYDR